MTLIIERGFYHLGMNKIRNGEVVEKTLPRWEANNDGGCIVISEVNCEDREAVGEADIFSFYDQLAILQKISQYMKFDTLFGNSLNEGVSKEQIELAELFIQNLHKLDSDAIYDISEIISENNQRRV